MQETSCTVGNLVIDPQSLLKCPGIYNVEYCQTQDNAFIDEVKNCYSSSVLLFTSSG